MEYVRLTFLPAGAKRYRTVWAEVISRGERTHTFWAVDREGEKEKETGKFQDGVPIVRQNLIVMKPNTYTAKSAVMSKKYGWLMTLDDPDLDNEVDNPKQEAE